MTPSAEKAINIIRQMGGTIRTTEAIRKGVHPPERCTRSAIAALWIKLHEAFTGWQNSMPYPIRIS